MPLLQTEKLAGDEPMIDETYDVLTPTLEVDHLIGDLTPNLKQGKPYKQSYWLPTFEASYIPPAGAPLGVGHAFALANEADATVIMYNKDEFKKAGVPSPSQRLDLERDARRRREAEDRLRRVADAVRHL